MNLFEYFENKKVLITGNTGFKGSWLTMWMLRHKAIVYGISDRIPTNPSMFEYLELEKKINHRFIDIRNYIELKKSILEIEPDYVFHLAAQPIVSISYTDPLATLNSNIIGSANLMEALKGLNNECVVIMVTSDKCYENVEQVWGYREIDQLGGKDIYSSSKGSAELIIHSYFHSFFKEKYTNVRICSARAGNVIGGGDFSKDRIVPDCMRAWKKGEKVTIRNPYSTRPWQHVLEPLSGYILLAAKLSQNSELNGESFNFGPKTEQNETVLNLIDSLSKYWDFNNIKDAYDYVVRTDFIEAGLLRLNCDKALTHLNWIPNLDYHQTIKLVSDWYVNFYSHNIEMKDIYSLTMSQIAEYEKIAGVERSNNAYLKNNIKK